MSMEAICHRCLRPKISGGLCLPCVEQKKADLKRARRIARGLSPIKEPKKKHKKVVLTPAQRARNAAWRANRDAKKRAIARIDRPVGVTSNLRYRRIRENGGRLSSGLVEYLMSHQQGLCACCGKALGGSYHLDHILPVAKGGRNSDENMQLLLPACNQTKHAKDPVAFMKTQRPAYVLVWARMLQERRSRNI